MKTVNRDRTWTQSVPPAVAGGYVVDTVGQRLRMHPPATAGGTDCAQPKLQKQRAFTRDRPRFEGLVRARQWLGFLPKSSLIALEWRKLRKCATGRRSRLSVKWCRRRRLQCRMCRRLATSVPTLLRAKV